MVVDHVEVCVLTQKFQALRLVPVEHLHPALRHHSKEFRLPHWGQGRQRCSDKHLLAGSRAHQVVRRKKSSARFAGPHC